MTPPVTPRVRAARMTAPRPVTSAGRPAEPFRPDDTGPRTTSHHDAPLEVDGRPTFALQGATG
ncbi:hypothetical protein [Kineosporia sp. A_224]|uniref:hypothetical protein n=1 Tax=Kineosporia sp. A_224 TaxID=1962180 RepID=UPI000B4A6F04|nr:hypothetical protein [Kineosporia sp. A_224]